MYNAILYTQVTWNEINKYNVNYIKGSLLFLTDYC